MPQKLDGSLGISTTIQLPDNFTESSGMDLYFSLSCDGASILLSG